MADSLIVTAPECDIRTINRATLDLLEKPLYIIMGNDAAKQYYKIKILKINLIRVYYISFYFYLLLQVLELIGSGHISDSILPDTIMEV